MVRIARIRLDELLPARGLAPSRAAARGLIMAGLVLVSGEVSDKAGTSVSVDADIVLKERPRFVSRAGDKVIALDVGRGQLDNRLRGHPRVHVLEKVNARYLTRAELPYEPDLLTMDVSFISVGKVLPAVVVCMAPRFEALVLIKPQFEAGPSQVGKGGIVRDPKGDSSSKSLVPSY